jgi:hypothetical protein
MVAVPDRLVVAVLAATATVTVPFPLPVAPAVIVIHDAPLVAVQLHPAAAPTVTEVVLASLPGENPPGEIE